MGYPQSLLQARRFFIACAIIAAALTLAASACIAQATPSPTPQDLAQYRELATTFAPLAVRLSRDLRFPSERKESRLLPLLPESTMTYAAFPNYGGVVHQALTIFQEEMQKNPALREAWKQGELATAGPEVVDSLEKVFQLSQFLGDEIVVSGSREGGDASLLIVAEVRKPGLKNFLQQTAQELAGTSKPVVRILDPQELAAAADVKPSSELLLLVRPDYVVGALDLATLRRFSKRVDSGNHALATTPFVQRIAQGYQDGVAILAAADLRKILSLVPPGSEQDRLTFERTGFADMKYLVWEHKNVEGKAFSEMELSFTGPRHGAASWLAPPATLGSLDFVSPKSIAAVTWLLKNPTQIIEEVKEIATASDPNAFAPLTAFEHLLKLSLKDDVLSHLGGEITLELDDITPPKPAWKAILRVNEPDRLKETLRKLLEFAHLPAEESVDGGITYDTVHVPSSGTTVEITYGFVDGYLIVASSHGVLAEAVRLHKSGEALGKSEKFLAALPPGHGSNASAVFYEDPMAVATLQLRQISPEMADLIAGRVIETKPIVACAYGEENAIRESSSGLAADVGPVMVVAAIAIPNLLRSRAAANESSAVATVRTVNVAEVTYASTFPDRGFAPDLATLGPNPKGTNDAWAEHANIMSGALTGASCTSGAWCTKSGFRFSISATCVKRNCSDYVVVATSTPSDTEGRSFCSTSDGVIRFNTGPPLISPIKASDCHAWEPLQK